MDKGNGFITYLDLASEINSAFKQSRIDRLPNKSIAINAMKF